MKKLLAIMFMSTMIAAVFIFGLIISEPSRPQDLAAAEPIVQDIVGDILKEREKEISEPGEAAFGARDEINILALGLDSRKEGHEQHCDSIHMITLHLKDWSMTITSVPRGTASTLPPGGDYKEYEYYLANACSYGGLDYGVKQIEKVLGVKADYVATVGFSQALGIFRALSLPTTDTLQWLRHRRGYQVGDPQRQHNQAIFMKDNLLKILSGDPIPVPFLYLMYTLVDSDMDFKTAKALYDAYYVSGLGERPADIKVTMKPYYKVVDYHYDPENADAQVEALVDFLKGKVNKEDLSLQTVDEIQAVLIEYLRGALANEDTIVHVYEEQMWRQVEDEKIREELHFRFLDKYVREIEEKDPDAAIQAVTDYILEKQYFELPEWEERGKRFLETIASERE
jgi:anionic cell wall polymer biosynthesis LytR-Cps2A-Psr (LCP) family protein